MMEDGSFEKLPTTNKTKIKIKIKQTKMDR